MTTFPGRISAWLALFRAPNLFTVPGDPWAGLVVASAVTGQPICLWQALAVGAVSVCFYMAGLVLNDLHDLPRDRRVRPERPLPSGRISETKANRVLIGLCVTGLLLALAAGTAVFLAAVVLLGLVVTYNVVVKHDPLRSCICMGLCRGASLMLGASATVDPAQALVPAIALAVMVGAVTAAFYGWLPLYLPELFPTRVRATGQGLSFNAGRILAAVGALQMGSLMQHFNGSYAKAGALITLIYIVGMVVIWMAPETKGKPLPA